MAEEYEMVVWFERLRKMPMPEETEELELVFRIRLLLERFR
jgi:hypothetical protein